MVLHSAAAAEILKEFHNVGDFKKLFEDELLANQFGSLLLLSHL